MSPAWTLEELFHPADEAGPELEDVCDVPEALKELEIDGELV
jgi:hypothetical protein